MALVCIMLQHLHKCKRSSDFAMIVMTPRLIDYLLCVLSIHSDFFCAVFNLLFDWVRHLSLSLAQPWWRACKWWMEEFDCLPGQRINYSVRISRDRVFCLPNWGNWDKQKKKRTEVHTRSASDKSFFFAFKLKMSSLMLRIQLTNALWLRAGSRRGSRGVSCELNMAWSKEMSERAPLGSC